MNPVQVDILEASFVVETKQKVMNAFVSYLRNNQ
jgi:hypothetical protein